MARFVNNCGPQDVPDSLILTKGGYASPASIKINNRQYKDNTDDPSDRPLRDSPSSCMKAAAAVADCGDCKWLLYDCNSTVLGQSAGDVINISDLHNPPYFWKLGNNKCDECCVPVYPDNEIVAGPGAFGYNPIVIATDCVKLSGSCCGLSKWMWIGCRSLSTSVSTGTNWCGSFYGTGWMLLNNGCGPDCSPLPPPVLGTEEDGDIQDARCARNSDIDTLPTTTGSDYGRTIGQPWPEIKEAVAKLACGPQSITITVSYVHPPTKYEAGLSVETLGDDDGVPSAAEFKADTDLAHAWWANLFNTTFSRANGYANDLTLSFSVLGDESGDVPNTGIDGETYLLADYPSVGDIRYAFHNLSIGTLAHAHHASGEFYECGGEGEEPEQLGVIGGQHGDIHFNPLADWRRSDTGATEEGTPNDGSSVANVAAHELGHVFGLVHEMGGLMEQGNYESESLANEGDGSDLAPHLQRIYGWPTTVPCSNCRCGTSLWMVNSFGEWGLSDDRCTGDCIPHYPPPGIINEWELTTGDTYESCCVPPYCAEMPPDCGCGWASWKGGGFSWEMIQDECSDGCKPSEPTEDMADCQTEIITCCECWCGETTYEWNGSSWDVLAEDCSGGCIAVEPEDDGQYLYQSLTTCCECECGNVLWRWSMFTNPNWILEEDNCTSEGDPPDFDITQSPNMDGFVNENLTTGTLTLCCECSIQGSNQAAMDAEVVPFWDFE